MKSHYARLGIGLALVLTAIAAIVLIGDAHAAAGFMLANVATRVAPADIVALIEKNHAAIMAHHSTVEQKLAEAQARLNGVEQELARKGGGGGTVHAQTPGEIFAKSEKWKQFAASHSRGRCSVKVGNFFAAMTSHPDSAGDGVFPQRLPGVQLLPQRRLTIRDLFDSGQTDSNMVGFVKETLRETNADVVSEGDLKPESRFTFDVADARVATIAHWTKATKQIMDDFKQLRTVIDTGLRYGLKLAEETEILYGDGTSPHFLGILPQATAFLSPIGEAAFQNRVDTLIQAIAQTHQALLPATGIVINDLDHIDLMLLKDANGQYLFPGGLNNIAGVPLVGSPAIPQHEFLVGAFRDGAQIFDREEANVEVATMNEDDFVRNMLTIRAEERLTLVVRRPEAFIHGTFQIGSGT